MHKYWIAANVALLAIAGLLGWQLKVSIDRFNAENDISKIQPVQDLKQKMTLEGGVPLPQAARVYNPADFDIIPAQNIFSESRTREEKTEAAVVQEAPALTTKPILVGVAVAGNQRLASIIDPTSQGGGRRSQIKRLGDTYQGYTITDITAGQIVLESGSRREVIPLHDPGKHPATGGKTAILATRVVAFGASGSGGPGGGIAPSPVPARTGPVPSPAAIGGGTPGQSGAARTPMPSRGMSGSTPQPQQPQPAWNERTDEQGRRVIRTPFGDIVRDRPPTP